MSYRGPRRILGCLSGIPSGSWASLGKVPAGLGRVCRFENEILKVRKWFTVFKTINHCSKIKEYRIFCQTINILC